MRTDIPRRLCRRFTWPFTLHHLCAGYGRGAALAFNSNRLLLIVGCRLAQRSREALCLAGIEHAWLHVLVRYWDTGAAVWRWAACNFLVVTLVVSTAMPSSSGS